MPFFPRIPLPPDPKTLTEPGAWEKWVAELNRQLDQCGFELSADTGAIALLNKSVPTSSSPIKAGTIIGAWGFRFPVSVLNITPLNTWFPITNARLHGYDRLSSIPSMGSAILSCSAQATHTYDVRMRNISDGATIFSWTGITSATNNYETLVINSWPANQTKVLQLEVQCTAGAVPTSFVFGEYQLLAWR